MIIIDMFEVQLGASILLRFTLEDESVVSVLADAGILAAGYKPEHVKDKLLHIFPDKETRRIDLIIGTHYDADHLRGLPPIISDDTFQIGEIWLPPVQNDEMDSYDEPLPFEEQFLGKQFEGERNGILRYLKAKSNRIKDLDSIIDGVLDRGELEGLHDSIAKFFPRAYPNDVNVREDNNDLTGQLKSYERYFEAIQGIQDEGLFGGTDFEANGFRHVSNSDLTLKIAKYNRHLYGENASDYLSRRWSYDKTSIKKDILSFAGIRKAQAKSAITAIYLHDVVKAIETRAQLSGQKIPCSYKYISQGRPTTYSWNNKLKQFIAGKNGNSNSLTLDILGPSDTLIEKHKDIIPIGDYVAFISIARKYITAANQLSYVVRFSYHSQNILIVGDAGFVDFRDNSGAIFTGLKAMLQPLQVVQVAHHAGNNYDFYNVLLEAGYDRQDENSFLLLSHAVKDKTRPSSQFENFVGQISHKASLLFTSRPDPLKVRSYLPLIHPPVPAHSCANFGDVCLEFNRRWSVTKHAIR